MNLINLVKHQFYNSSLFKGVLAEYSKANNVRLLRPEDIEQKIQSTLAEQVQTKVSEEISKIDLMKKNDSMRFRMTQQRNMNTNPDRKPLSDVPFSFLRRMAIMYPIARACINRRIRQVTNLGWDITTLGEDVEEDAFQKQIDLVKEFFRHPMGHKSRMSKLLNILVDDILTVDATCFEYQKTRKGEFMYLVPVDPTTIVLKLLESGGIPQPPQSAYAQIIEGEIIAEFSTDEMLYEMMSTRSYSPYGLAPLESLILQTESALRGTLYNLNYMRESNVPEGFLTLPDDVATNKDQVEEWQMWFDSIVAGDPRMMHRLKIIPGGSEYTAAKKPEDMAFERFELWLLQQTCAVFDVQPQDIGITLDVNKATAGSQEEIAKERGLYPLANFIKEIFDQIIQVDMGFTELQLIWTTLNPVDRKEEVEIAEKEIAMGALGVDEYRIEQGREPLGLQPYIKTSGGIIPVEDVVSGKYTERQDKQLESKNNVDPKEDKDKKEKEDAKENKEKMVFEELRKWRKVIFKRLEAGKTIDGSKFVTEYIDSDTRDSIVEGLKKVHSKTQAKLLFDTHLDMELKTSLKLLQIARNLRQANHADTTEDDP